MLKLFHIMDKLLVDIDQVLDDFEQSERNQTNYAFNQLNCLSLKDEIQSQIDETSNGLTLSTTPFINSSTEPNASDFQCFPSNDAYSQTNLSRTECDSADESFSNKFLLDHALTLLTESTFSSNSKQTNSTLPIESADLHQIRPVEIFKGSKNDASIKDISSTNSINEPNYESFKKLNDQNSFKDKSSNDAVNEKSAIQYSSDNELIEKQLNDSPSNRLITDKFVPDCLIDESLDYTSTSLLINQSTSNSAHLERILKPMISETTCEQSKSDTQFDDKSNDKPIDKMNDVSNIYKLTSDDLSSFASNEIILNDKSTGQLGDQYETANLDLNNQSAFLANEFLIDQGSASEMSTNPFVEDETTTSQTNPFEEDDHLDSGLVDAYSSQSSSVRPNAENSRLVSATCSVGTSLIEPENGSTATTQQSGQQLAVRCQAASTKNLEKNNLTSFQNDQQLNHELSSTSNSSQFCNEFDGSDETVHSYDEQSNSNRNVLNESNIDDLLSNSVGYVKPYWLPDLEAPNCMFCGVKFNIINRRHHCRACGHIGCSLCCHYFIKLPYLGFKEGRVCKICVNLLDSFKDGEVDSRRSSRNSSIVFNQNHQQTHSSTSNLSVATSSTMGAMLPSSSIRPTDENAASLVSVLKKPSDRAKEQQTSNKQVIFFDGIRPGNDLTENLLTDNQSSSSTNVKVNRNVSSFPSLSTFSTLLFPSSNTASSLPSPLSAPAQIEQQTNAEKPTANKTRKGSLLTTLILQDLNGALPPIINATSLQSESTFADLVNYLDADESNYLRFQITKNLCINVNRVKLDDNQMVCWSFTSDGLSAFGQDEILILLEGPDMEVYFPRDILRLYLHVYDSAFKGKPIADLNLMLFEDGMFENKENCGFLFFSSALFYRSTLKCLGKVPKPQSPFLVGILIQKWEIPWAKSLPLRLLLRLAAQSNTYPCSIVSQWSRKTAFQEIGHTIMNVLADFRNFQYTLPFIPGLFVQLHLLPNNKRKVVVKIANNRHDLILKALNSSNDYVLAFGSNLELSANYHLTCMQNDDQYLTQIISRNGGVNEFSLNNLESNNEYISEIIGCSYVVFSGALKTESGLHQSKSQGKFSIVEDGILVQLFPNSLEKLKSALKQKADFNLNCMSVGSDEINESSVSVVWGEDDLNFNIGIASQIDGRSLEGVPSIRIYNGDQYNCIGERHLIRFTEVFFIQHDHKKAINSIEYTRMASVIAQQLLVTLTPHLEKLVKEGIKKLSLRVNLDSNPDNVDNYAVSTNIGSMPNNLTTELDSGLIPLIIQLQSNSTNDQALIIELLFFILNK